MSSGWISLHRRLKDNWLWKEKRVFSRAEAWIDILLSANHTDNKFLLGNSLVEVKRGSFITSELKLVERWSWSKTKVRSFLNLLQDDKMIIKKSDNKKTTVTVVNYSDYQVSETTKKPKKNQSSTSKKPQKDTNNNEDNDINKDNNIYRKFKHLELSIEDFNKLEEDYTKSSIDNILDRIENYKKNKNYTSLYLTALNWLKKEYPKGDDSKGDYFKYLNGEMEAPKYKEL